ncbi:MAG: MscS family membrane protein [Saprospiraceae bacterium]
MAQAVSEELVCKYPAPRVRFREFGNSGLAYELLCWIDEPELSGRETHQLNSSVHQAFIRSKMEIPFPKQDLYIKQLPK